MKTFIIIFLFPLALFAADDCFEEAATNYASDLKLANMDARTFCGNRKKTEPIWCVKYFRDRIGAGPAIYLCKGVKDIDDPVSCYRRGMRPNPNDPGNIALAKKCNK
jgi:hypothetical protein